MELIEHRCKNCGGALVLIGTQYHCHYCGSVYDIKTAEDHTKAMKELFDEAKEEIVNNLRRNLYDAVNAQYISREDVKGVCNELRKYLPDDFAANFFKTASGNDIRQTNEAISNIDTAKHYRDAEFIIKFLVRSMTADNNYLLALNDLVERTYKNRDLVLYSKYATMVSEQAVRVQSGVYETSIPREVFVAYSSKDMKYVMELVDALEEQGLSCFVAARNLRHGVGSVENYDKALKEAIDNCRTVVFISSMNSRNFGCDALKIELAYIKAKDIEKAPAQYQNHYDNLPHEYKKPRVEYRIEESNKKNAADDITDQFFNGYERVYTADAVVVRVAQQLCEIPAVVIEPTVSAPTHQPTQASANSTSESENLLKRAFMFLEDKNWAEANSYCERVLDRDPENARAYLGKLLAELHVSKQEELKKCKESFSGSINYQKVVKFGTPNLKTALAQAIDQINGRNELQRKSEIYQKAINLMCKSEEKSREAAKLFESVKDYKDSADKVRECLEDAERQQKQRLARAEAEENARLEEMRRRGAEILAKKRKAKIVWSTIGCSLAAIILMIVFITTVIVPSSNYNKALECIEKGQNAEAFYLLDSLGDYKDSKEQMSKLTIKLGKYEQDNNTSNGAEDIEWLILAEENGKALVISRYALDNIPYNNPNESVTWETSDIRAWLNGEFLNSAFSESEQSSILSVTVSNDNNSVYGTDGGNDTTDKLFLLSRSEFEKHFSSKKSSSVLYTDYAIRRSYFLEKGEYADWWLRTPGNDNTRTVVVGSNNKLADHGWSVDYDRDVGVRPAFWIELE